MSQTNPRNSRRRRRHRPGRPRRPLRGRRVAPARPGGTRLDDAPRVLVETQADLLVVAAQGYSDRALFLVDQRRQGRSRPARAGAQPTTSPSGFVRRVFEMGGEDILMLPQSPRAGSVRRREDARPPPRAALPRRGHDLGRHDRRARAEGWHGQDADEREPRPLHSLSVACARRSSTSISSSATSASAWGFHPT